MWSSFHSSAPSLSLPPPPGNPVPVEDVVSGKVFLLFSRDTKHVLVMESKDECRTWNNMVDITSMVALPTWFKVAPSVPGGLQLPSGRLIVGMSESLYMFS